MERFLIEEKMQTVGEVTLKKTGMFYKITCRLYEPFEEKCRIQVQLKEQSLDLGICASYGNFYGCVRSVPVRVLGDGPFHFVLTKQVANKLFVPISNQNPFPFLWKIPNGKLAQHMNQPGIWLDEEI